MSDTLPSVKPIADYAAKMLSAMAGVGDELLRRAVTRLLEVLDEGGTCVALSDLGDEAEVEAKLTALNVVGRAGDERPLIIDKGLLYLHRYHAYETRLATQLVRLARIHVAPPASATGDERRILSHALGVVTGGPGTGKTTLAARLLGLVADASSHPLSVALMAPTGKAAARLMESMRRITGERANLSIRHGTVHRLLGSRPDSVFFKHDAAHPLSCDIVVLDEASMMDLPLMSKLVDAIDSRRTRLLILGDPGQLPSIYSGSILADIVAAAERAVDDNAIAPCFVRLTKNHRSGEQPQLAKLVDAVRNGDGAAALECFDGDSLVIQRPPMPSQMPEFVEAELYIHMKALRVTSDASEALAQAARYRLVCMLRQGPCGAQEVNELALDIARKHGFAERGAHIFHGLPIIITRNDMQSGLFNGDSGVILRKGNGLCAYFESDTGPRAVSLQSLPPFEAAYAITVHRGQGSEYGAVTLLLPSADHPLLTRELFYTGISRARNKVKVLGTPELLRLALSRTERRASGLAGRL